MKKISIIGSGFVGSTIGYAITLRNLADEVVLIDVNRELAEGEALDISHGIGCFGGTKIRVGEYRDCGDSEIIIITAGINRKVGQSREDLLDSNKHIMDSILDSIQPWYKDSLVMIVSNPVDVLTGYAAKRGFIPANKICGTGCMLDTSRWVSELGKYLNVTVDRIRAYAVGVHGSNQRMLWDRAVVDGMPVEEFCRKSDIPWDESIRNCLHEKVTDMGAEIISRKGKTQFGIATAVAYIVECMGQTGYTLVSLGNVLYSEKACSDLVLIGKYEVRLPEDVSI